MNDTEKLLAIEEIKQTKARYCRAIDTKSFDELRAVFAADAVFDAQEALFDPVLGNPEGSTPPEPMEGLETIVTAVSGMLASAQSVHHVNTPEIEFVTDSKAKAVFPMEDRVRSDTVAFHGYGYYEEVYSREADGWRIASSRIKRLRVIVGA